LAGNRPHEEILSDARKARAYIRDISRSLALSLPPTVEPSAVD
jgi:hypothetical protein